MSVKEKLNNDTTGWILRGIVLLALGWFFREGAYMRDRLATVETRQQQLRARVFSHDEGQQLRDAILEIERLMHTKDDAQRMRAELVRAQEILNERIRELEMGTGR